MTAATTGCIEAPHDHVDQCHQAGRAEVEAKYAALVAAVEGDRDHWKGHAEEAGAGFAQVCKDYARVAARNVALVEQVEAIAQEMGSAHSFDQWDELCVRLRAVLAYPAEGGDRG